MCRDPLGSFNLTRCLEHPEKVAWQASMLRPVGGSVITQKHKCVSSFNLNNKLKVALAIGRRMLRHVSESETNPGRNNYPILSSSRTD